MGRGGNGKYCVETVRREAESTKCIPGFIGGLYRTFYYNLGDDSFLYIACYTAEPLQPVNVQRGPGLAVPASPRPGKGLRPSTSLRPGPATAPQPLDLRGETSKKVKRQERLKGVHAPPFRSGVCLTVGVCAWPVPSKASGASLSSAGDGCRAQLARHCVRVCLYKSMCICVEYACVRNRHACVYYTCMCACVRGSEPETLPCCIPAWWGATPGRVSPTLSHTLCTLEHRHTQGSHDSFLSAVPRRPGRG